MLFRIIYDDFTSYEWDDAFEGTKGYLGIDRKRVKTVELVYNGKTMHRLHLEKGQRLILRTRSMLRLILNRFTETIKREEREPEFLYLVGFQETIAGQNRQSIIAIFEDGHTEHISQWKNSPLDAVKLQPQEMDEAERKVWLAQKAAEARARAEAPPTGG